MGGGGGVLTSFVYSAIAFVQQSALVMPHPSHPCHRMAEWQNRRLTDSLTRGNTATRTKAPAANDRPGHSELGAVTPLAPQATMQEQPTSPDRDVSARQPGPGHEIHTLLSGGEEM